MSKKLKAGIAGAGLMGYWHANAARRAGANICAIADTNIEASRRLADKYPGVETYSTIEQMVDNVTLDVLHICTPLDTHVSIAEFAISAGVNLIVEKPVTPTEVETGRILEQAANSGVILCAVHQFLFQEGVLKAKRLLSQIGRIVHIESTICSAGADSATGKQCDLIVADVLPHPLSLMQSFVPGEILSDDWYVVRPDYGELHAVSNKSSIHLSIFISMKARPTECSLKIQGTQGTIHMDLFHGFAVFESGKVSETRKIINPFEFAIMRLFAATANMGRRIIRWEPAYPGLERLVGLFYEAVLTKGVSPISGEDTLVVARIRDRLIQNSGFIN